MHNRPAVRLIEAAIRPVREQLSADTVQRLPRRLRPRIADPTNRLVVAAVRLAWCHIREKYDV